MAKGKRGTDRNVGEGKQALEKGWECGQVTGQEGREGNVGKGKRGRDRNVGEGKKALEKGWERGER